MTHDAWAFLAARTQGPVPPVDPTQTNIPNKDRLLRRKKLILQGLGPNAKEKAGDLSYKDLAKEEARKVALNLLPSAQDFKYVSPAAMPPVFWNSATVLLKWKLKTNFFSRSDSEFDVVDNPLSRDSLTGHPILKSTGAKGMMRGALQMILPRGNEDEARQSDSILSSLFGLIKEENDEGSGGNTVFGDVVFSGEIAAGDMFSPHNREFGVVRQPIGFEVVPAGATAELGILVFDRKHDPAIVRSSLLHLLNAAQVLIQDLGMSAKRSVSFGVGGAVSVTIRSGGAVDLGEAGRCIVPLGNTLRCVNNILRPGEDLCQNEDEALARILDAGGDDMDEQHQRCSECFAQQAEQEVARKAWEADLSHVHWEFDDIAAAIESVEALEEAAQ